MTLVSQALAAHGVTDTGSSGGGVALLIILGVAILAGFGYAVLKRMRSRRQDATPTGDGEEEDGPLETAERCFDRGAGE